MNDPYELQRFVDAQASIYDQALAELRAGRKRSHWMWFVFPQIQGLGYSDMARRYAIGDLDEARAYLAHPLLGPRLLECTAAVTALRGLTAHQVFGSPDDRKFHSSLTLFQQADGRLEVLSQALGQYFDGDLDAATLSRLGA